jgi:hypothetical protein
MTLDCSSIDSALASLEAIFSLDHSRIRSAIARYDPDEYIAAHPCDERRLREILPEVICANGGQLRYPDVVYWFHGTRLLRPEGVKSMGLRTLHDHIDAIWEDLFRLAGQWINQKQWEAFRRHVETADQSESSERYRRRIANFSDTGPHAC